MLLFLIVITVVKVMAANERCCICSVTCSTCVCKLPKSGGESVNSSNTESHSVIDLTVKYQHLKHLQTIALASVSLVWGNKVIVKCIGRSAICFVSDEGTERSEEVWLLVHLSTCTDSIWFISNLYKQVKANKQEVIGCLEEGGMSVAVVW